MGIKSIHPLSLRSWIFESVLIPPVCYIRGGNLTVNSQENRPGWQNCDLGGKKSATAKALALEREKM